MMSKKTIVLPPVGSTTYVNAIYISKDPKHNPRKVYSDEGWKKLVEGMECHGQLSPADIRLTCHYDKILLGIDPEEFPFVMENGNSRAKAREEMTLERDAQGVRKEDLYVTIQPSLLDRANKKLATLEIPPEKVAEKKLQLAKECLVEIATANHQKNTVVERWNAWAEAHSLNDQMVILKTLHPDKDEKQLLVMLGDTNGMKADLVKMRLSLLDETITPKDVQERLEKGELTYSGAIELRRITDEKVREDLSEKSYLGGWSANQLKKKIDSEVKKASGEGRSIKSSRKKRSKPGVEDKIIAILEEVKLNLDGLSDSEEDFRIALEASRITLEATLTTEEVDILFLLEEIFEDEE